MQQRLLAKFTRQAKIVITTKSNCLKLRELSRKAGRSNRKLKIVERMKGYFDSIRMKLKVS